MGKFDTFKKYPHLENLVNTKSINIVSSVVVTEKIHGCNARFGWCDGEFVIGTRNQHAALSSVADNYGMGLAAWLRKNNLEERLKDLKHLNAMVYGELYGEGIQKGIFYRKGKHFRAFMVRVHDHVLDWSKTEKFLKENDIDCVPVLHCGEWRDGDVSLESFLRTFYDKESLVPGLDGFSEQAPENNICEGVVVCPTIALRDGTGDLLITKFKNDKWKEKLGKIVHDKHPLSRLETDTAIQFTTRPRLINVLGHMEAEGMDIHTMRSLGEVIKRMNKDILQEPRNTELNRRRQGRWNILEKD